MYDLKKLKEAASAACEKAYEKRSEFCNEAINWGDLKCICAEYCVSDEGSQYHRVIIDEAAPDCSRFQGYIYDCLHESGFPDVQVFTEW